MESHATAKSTGGALSRNQINVLATLCSGTLIFVTFYPLEVLELRNQLGKKMSSTARELGLEGKLATSSSTTAKLSKQSITRQLVNSLSTLGVRGIYKGFSPASVQATAGWVLYYCLFDYTRCLYSRQPKTSNVHSKHNRRTSSTSSTSSSSSPAADCIGAVVAGTLGTVFNTPLQVLKVRMINENTSVAKTLQNIYKESASSVSPSSTLRQSMFRSSSPTNVTAAGIAALPVARIQQVILNATNTSLEMTARTLYPRSQMFATISSFRPTALMQTSRQVAVTLPQFYKGLTPSMFGVLEGMVQLPLYEGIKTHLSQSRAASGSGIGTSVTDSIVAACAARTVACVSTYPYQVVRSRLQVSSDTNMANMVRYVYKSEGIGAFWSGCRINLTRTVVPAGLLYTMNDWMRERLTARFG